MKLSFTTPHRLLPAHPTPFVSPASGFGYVTDFGLSAFNPDGTPDLNFGINSHFAEVVDPQLAHTTAGEIIKHIFLLAQ